MAEKNKYEFPFKTQAGTPPEEGVWVDKFGELIHVRRQKDCPEDFEYRGQDNLNYIGLRSYAELLVCKLKDPRQSAAFLEKLAQTQTSQYPVIAKSGLQLEAANERHAKSPPNADLLQRLREREHNLEY